MESSFLHPDITDAAVFRTFVQAGFECSTHRNLKGARLDLVSSTGHDRFVEQDYRRLKEFGMLTAREGLRWHLIERESGVRDFSTVLPFLHAAQEAGIQIIWDLLHFGWPDHLNIFEPDWVKSFAEFAAGFAGLLRRETSTFLSLYR